MTEPRIVEVYISNTPNDAGGFYTHRLLVREDGTGVYWTDVPVPGMDSPQVMTADETQHALNHWGLAWDLVQVAE